MTNQTPESVISEVIEYHADTIGSHYDGCHKHHAVCLAVKLRDMLREPGEPNDDREALLEADELYDSIGVTLFRAEFRETYTKLSRATVPDAATEEAFKKAVAFDKAVALSERRQTLLEEAETERDAAEARVKELEAGVECEYGYRSTRTGNRWGSGSLLDAQLGAKAISATIERRRKAGPWVPVESEGE